MKEVGDACIFVDCMGKKHPALITAVWSESCVNLLYVSGSKEDTDSYGRQIKRENSVVSSDRQDAHGNYWY